ncbi:aromatic ring-hydroxylating dioxygenase subunit alpha [Frankia sp. R82]|uniref:aromatic ring-hydroxylating oxygenase subunit alpha n=1 Tax=Frankia sp. R82 TaxID=2950553 RepID=UPI00204301B9|nr:aromatic ring-hydroxylating dioxygenase subunit alpha [Frankia sp. R82]MCM3884426.1 aromatic ring-hydroxylating dioxygenase subunit alpha [Frankia sp. R82]
MARLLRNTEPALRHGWHPVALAAEVGGVPLQVRLLGEPWVVARLGEALVAFADRCPHRFAPLSTGRVDDGELVCGYHGWRFGSAGVCTVIPALGAGVPPPRRARATPAWGVAERHGLVWIAPAQPVADLIDLPDADMPGFDAMWLPPTLSTACAGLLADNFLDTAHFPFVHAATIGAGEDTRVAPYRVQPDGPGFVVRMDQEVANPEDPLVATGEHPRVQRRRSTYAYQPPFMLRLRLEYPDAATTSTILFCLQPQDEHATRIFTLLLRDDLGGDPARMAEAIAFEQAVLDEDLALLERFDLAGLPLPGTDDASGDGRTPGRRRRCADGGWTGGEGWAGEDVSIRADAAGVALRRALAELVARRGSLDGADAPPDQATTLPAATRS